MDGKDKPPIDQWRGVLNLTTSFASSSSKNAINLASQDPRSSTSVPTLYPSGGGLTSPINRTSPTGPAPVRTNLTLAQPARSSVTITPSGVPVTVQLPPIHQFSFVVNPTGYLISKLNAYAIKHKTIMDFAVHAALPDVPAHVFLLATTEVAAAEAVKFLEGIFMAFRGSVDLLIRRVAGLTVEDIRRLLEPIAVVESIRLTRSMVNSHFGSLAFVTIQPHNDTPLAIPSHISFTYGRESRTLLIEIANKSQSRGSDSNPPKPPNRKRKQTASSKPVAKVPRTRQTHQPKPRRHCANFLLGSCPVNACIFAHDARLTTRRKEQAYCRLFLRGSCSRGKQCRHYHAAKEDYVPVTPPDHAHISSPVGPKASDSHMRRPVEFKRRSASPRHTLPKDPKDTPSCGSAEDDLSDEMTSDAPSSFRTLLAAAKRLPSDEEMEDASSEEDPAEAPPSPHDQ